KHFLPKDPKNFSIFSPTLPREMFHVKHFAGHSHWRSNTPVQVGHLRRPQVVRHVVFGVCSHAKHHVSKRTICGAAARYMGYCPYSSHVLLYRKATDLSSHAVIC